MKAIVKWKGDLAFQGKAGSGHWVPMDTRRKEGELSVGTAPMELVLLGLGSCTAMDTISILNKKQVQVDDFWVELASEAAADHPRVFTSVRLKFVFVGQDIPLEAAKRSVELSQERYCPVTAMLRKGTEITYEIEIKKE